MYRIHHLMTLRTVARTGSFAVAARELGYTSSAISQQIAALEKDTGLVLFEREAHGLRTTSAAHRLVELSRGLLASMEQLEAQVRRLADGRSGRIRVGAFPTASERVLPAVLSAFDEAAPEVEVTLREGEPDDLAALLVDGELDIALLFEYGLCPRDWPDAVTRMPLLREDLVLLRPKSARAPSDLARLKGYRWITSRDGTAGALSLARLCAAAGFNPDIAHRSNNYDVVRELVAATSGVAIVPGLGHRPDDRITAHRLATASAHRTVLLAHRAGNTNPALEGFLAEVRRRVPDMEFVADLAGQPSPAG